MMVCRGRNSPCFSRGVTDWGSRVMGNPSPLLSLCRVTTPSCQLSLHAMCMAQKPAVR